MSLLQKKSQIAKYEVTFPIKEGAYADTYRVKDESGAKFFLKLIDLTKLDHNQFDPDGQILEESISKVLNHPNTEHLHDSGRITINSRQMCYLVYDFIGGETVAATLVREKRLSVYEAKRIALGVLEGLKFLQGLNNPVVHGEITPENIMLDLAKSPSTPKMIDFGHAQFLNHPTGKSIKWNISPFFQAPEALNGVFTFQSDLFSVGALLYQCVFGMPPYYAELPDFQKERTKVLEILAEQRSKPLRIPDIEVFELDDDLLLIMAKALAVDVDERFQSADDFIKALKGEIKLKGDIAKPKAQVADEKSIGKKHIRKGNGFADVAGMDELKRQMQNDVIDLLKEPERAKALGLSMPNGLLLYGPPGCGKTFFAERFAEEAGFNFIEVSCSDVASPFIHGGQEKIAKLFDEARKNAPTILFLDEIDAMLTDRSKHNNVSESGEVNEFLTQLNNCGEDGVLVIGATNKTSEIDKAALRAGRLELKYYVPEPDENMRAALFELEIKKRRYDFGIDYEKLAKMTQGFSAAQISLAVNKAGLAAFRYKTDKITMEYLESAINSMKPELTSEALKEFETMRDEFQGTKREERRRVGFDI